MENFKQYQLGFFVMSLAATTDITHKIMIFFQRKLLVTKKHARDDLSPNTNST